jgi:lysozyme
MNLTRLYAQLENDEGRRKKPYRCTAGKLSIGVGRNLEDRGLRDDEIDLMLKNDVAESIGECRRLFRMFDSLSAVRQEVLVNMMLNLGYSRLAGFKKMHAALEDGNWGEASRQMLDSKWASDVGRRADRLAEAMRTGAF